jgi:regulator of RNase E activity RraB
MGILDFFSKSKTKTTNSPVTGRSWDTYYFYFGEKEDDEFIAVVTFDENAVQNQKGYDKCRRIIFCVDGKNVFENGLITSDEEKKITKYQNELLKLLKDNKVDFKFVGRQTYLGVKDLVFQVNDVNNFDKIAKDWAAKITDYKIEFKELKGWDFFNAKIKPDEIDRQQIDDRNIIDTLIKNGSNPKKLHFIEHVFIGDKKDLEKIKKQLEKRNFREVQFENGTLVMGTKQPLILNGMYRVTSMLLSLSNDNNVKYDGWGTKVVK